MGPALRGFGFPPWRARLVFIGPLFLAGANPWFWWGASECREHLPWVWLLQVFVAGQIGLLVTLRIWRFGPTAEAHEGPGGPPSTPSAAWLEEAPRRVQWAHTLLLTAGLAVPAFGYALVVLGTLRGRFHFETVTVDVSVTTLALGTVAWCLARRSWTVHRLPLVAGVAILTAWPQAMRAFDEGAYGEGGLVCLAVVGIPVLIAHLTRPPLTPDPV